jgi:nucleoside-diphosphate-sugar epimerase
MGVVSLEEWVISVPRLEGLVLRYGQLYGPGTWNSRPAGSAPVHVNAAARTAALAVARGEPGVYNIVDDGGAVSNAKARAALGWDPGLR